MASVIQGQATGDLEFKAGTGRTVKFTTDALGSIDIAALATQGFVTAQINNVIDAAPGALDTLNELAAALGDDANYSTTITNALATKANSADVYTKTAADLLLAAKANSATTLAGYGITDAQALDATLTALAGVVTTANALIYATAADTFATTTLSAFGRSLIDDADAATSRTTLGLGSLATLSSINNSNWSGTVLSVTNGGTGAATLTGYVKGSGTAALTASSTIPNTDITGLGTMSTQSAASVAITGGSITNLSTFDGITIDCGTF